MKEVERPLSFFMKTVLVSLLLFLLGFVGVISVQMAHLNEVKDLIAPPPHLEHYSFGMRSQFADLLWIRSIQDFDYCDQTLGKNLCKGNSWLYQMLDSLTNLDSHYYIAYSAGGLALTVLVSDYAGASKIFDKGIKIYPNDWKLLYRAAYHVLYEENNYPKAAELFKRVGENGGPEWTLKLASRLNTRSGQVEVGERLLEDLIRRKEDEHVIQRLREKIEALKEKPE